MTTDEKSAVLGFRYNLEKIWWLKLRRKNMLEVLVTAVAYKAGKELAKKLMD